MGDKPALTLVSHTDEFFHELVTATLGRRKLSTKPETEFYLVNLLNRFLSSTQLPEEPLAFMLKDALEEPAPRAQAARFQQVGDVSLYVAGFFQDSLNRKLVDVDYYIDMGETAYQQVASRAPEETFRAVFTELAERFSKFVDVLAEIGDQTSQKTEKDILRVYELWVRTKSERAAKQLQEAGILPNETVKKEWQ